MASEEKLKRRRKNAPRWLILGLAASLLVNTGLLIANYQVQDDNHTLLSRETALINKYQQAAKDISAAATPLAYDVSLICASQHLACKTLPLKVTP